MPGKRRPLSDFSPVWLPNNPGHLREKMGIGFTCPVHRDHPVAFYFRHPLDGEPAQPLVPLVEIDDFLGGDDGMESFDEVTLYFRADDVGPLVAPCGAMFWVVGGEVICRHSKLSGG